MKVEDWHAGLVQSLEAVSDIDRQRRAWIDGSDTQFPTLVELICGLFDDTGIKELLAKGAVFSGTTDAMLRRLSSYAKELDLDAPPETLLSSKHWIAFTREAARVLSSVRADLAE